MTEGPILVFGAGGYIGSHLTTALVQAGIPVKAFDFHRDPQIKSGPNYEFIKGDFFNPENLRRALEGCSLVYHLISTSLPASSNKDPGRDVQDNVMGSIRMMDLAVEAGVKKIVFISSGGTVYGRTNAEPIKETTPTDPICSYGITKLAVEKYLHLYYTLKGLDYSILRVSNPYGGAQPTDRPQGFIGVAVEKIKRKETIQIWGDGEVIRDYIHINDVVSAMLIAARLQTREKIFNIGSGQGRSINEILALCEKAGGEAVQREYSPGREVDVSVNILDNSRAKQILNWSPEIDFEKGLEEFLKTEVTTSS